MREPIDALAIAAHRDDVEQTCGGTLLKLSQAGHRTAILDLTAGEMGTRGSAEQRAREAEEAARLLGVAWRGNLGLANRSLVPDLEARAGARFPFPLEDCPAPPRAPRRAFDHAALAIRRKKNATLAIRSVLPRKAKSGDSALHSKRENTCAPDFP